LSWSKSKIIFLILAGADLVDGTPILDVKTLFATYESRPHARGGWTDEVHKDEIQVEFT